MIQEEDLLDNYFQPIQPWISPQTIEYSLSSLWNPLSLHPSRIFDQDSLNYCLPVVALNYSNIQINISLKSKREIATEIIQRTWRRYKNKIRKIKKIAFMYIRKREFNINVRI